jgi:leucyl aminopeptidase
MPFVENMIGNMACKSGDIITSMNGKTIEIISTDAEGRLILADALWYAEKFYKPDVMIDIATLTSGTRIALGPVYSSLMSHDEQLAQKLMALGEKCGDRVWRMPLDNRYAKALKSKRADLMNQAPKDFGASSIMGAQFLSSFVVCPHWAHLDIAGTVRKTHQAGKSATGAGVRLLIEYISPCNELYS